MEVDQLHDVEAADGAELVNRLHELRGVEAELRFLAPALLPPPEPARRELDANPGRRRDSELVGDREQHVDLAQLLDDDEYLVPELLPHQGEAHELLVLVAVADDEMLGAFRESQHGLQLRLGAALEAHAVLVAELHDLLDDVALLVHLDRVHGGVRPGVLVLLDRVLESFAQRLDPRAEDVGEPEQHGERDTLLLEIARQIVEAEVPLGVLFIRTHDHVAALVDVEESGAPALNVVERARLLRVPSRLGSRSSGGRLDSISRHPQKITARGADRAHGASPAIVSFGCAYG